MYVATTMPKSRMGELDITDVYIGTLLNDVSWLDNHNMGTRYELGIVITTRFSGHS